MDGIGWSPDRFIEGIPRTVFPFICGVCMYHFSRRLPEISARWALWPPIILALAIALPLDHVIGATPYSVGCVAVLFPALILVSSKVRTGETERLIAQRLGRLSYPLYATHYPILIVLAFLSNNLGIQHGFVTLLAASAVAASMAYFAEKYFDVRVRYYLRRRLLPAHASRQAAHTI